MLKVLEKFDYEDLIHKTTFRNYPAQKIHITLLSIYPFIYQSIYLSIFLFIYLSF